VEARKDMTQLEAFEMWVWRRMERISWTEKRANMEVLKRMRERELDNCR